MLCSLLRCELGLVLRVSPQLLPSVFLALLPEFPLRREFRLLTIVLHLEVLVIAQAGGRLLHLAEEDRRTSVEGRHQGESERRGEEKQ
jgi:hypothetical protein